MVPAILVSEVMGKTSWISWVGVKSLKCHLTILSVTSVAGGGMTWFGAIRSGVQFRWWPLQWSHAGASCGDDAGNMGAGHCQTPRIGSCRARSSFLGRVNAECRLAQVPWNCLHKPIGILHGDAFPGLKETGQV